MSNKEQPFEGSTDYAKPHLERGGTTTSTKVAPQGKTHVKASKAVVERVKKPTVKDLQQQVENLSVQLKYANEKLLTEININSKLSAEYVELLGEYRTLDDECTLEFSKSWWTVTKERFMMLFI